MTINFRARETATKRKAESSKLNHSSLIDDLLAASPRSKRKSSQLAVPTAETSQTQTQLRDQTQITVCEGDNSSLPTMRDVTTPPASPVQAAITVTNQQECKRQKTEQAPVEPVSTTEAERFSQEVRTYCNLLCWLTLQAPYNGSPFTGCECYTGNSVIKYLTAKQEGKG